MHVCLYIYIEREGEIEKGLTRILTPRRPNSLVVLPDAHQCEGHGRHARGSPPKDMTHDRVNPI